MQNINLYGIIGKPLGHSLSPKLHNWAFAELKHMAMFKSWTLEREHLQDFITAMHSLRICGLCVTIPFKQDIIPLLDEISPRAKDIGAVNTLYWQNDKLCGENTDVDGFKLPLVNRAKAKTALVIGAGGAARAAVMGLKELKIEQIYVCARNEQACKSLAQHFNVQSIAYAERENLDAQWIINATPLGMKGTYETQSPYIFKPQGKDFLAYDIVYNPLKTKFLLDAEKAGFSTQDGLDMFVGQALSQMQLWMGKSVKANEARDFLIKGMGL